VKAYIRKQLEARKGLPKPDFRRRSAYGNLACVLSEVPVAASCLCKEAARLAHEYAVPGKFVYFVECDGFVKIGYSGGRVEERADELSLGSPLEQAVAARLPGDRYLETLLHDLFKSYHHRGEWFRVEGDLAEFLNGIRDKEFSNRREIKRLEKKRIAGRNDAGEIERLSLLTAMR